MSDRAITAVSSHVITRASAAQMISAFFNTTEILGYNANDQINTD